MTKLVLAAMIAAMCHPTVANAGCPQLQINCEPRTPVKKDTGAPSIPSLVGSSAVAAGLGAVGLSATGAGEIAWSVGVAGIEVGGTNGTAVAGGIRFGISDRVSMTATISASPGSDAKGASISIGGKF